MHLGLGYLKGVFYVLPCKFAVFVWVYRQHQWACVPSSQLSTHPLHNWSHQNFQNIFKRKLVSADQHNCWSLTLLDHDEHKQMQRR